jgi:predicted metal-dependent phosphoesterase TrpH
VRIDLHVHTVYSGDSSISINELSKWCSLQTKLDGIAITDHDNIDGYNRLMKIRKNEKEPRIIPGIEISFTKGHIIILNVLEEPKRSISTIGELLDYAQAQGGLIIIPHPYRFSGLRDQAQDFPADAIEILNPTASSRENQMAKLLAKSRELPCVAGSDAHDFEDIGRVFNLVQCDNSIDEIIKAIKIGKIRPTKIAINN